MNRENEVHGERRPVVLLPGEMATIQPDVAELPQQIESRSALPVQVQDLTEIRIEAGGEGAGGRWSLRLTHTKNTIWRSAKYQLSGY